MRPGDTFAPARRNRLFTLAAAWLLIMLAGGAVVGLMRATSASDDCPWPDVRNAAGRSDRDTSAAGRDDPCDMVAGPARDYCYDSQDPQVRPEPGTAVSPSAPCSASRTLGQGVLCAGGVAVLVSVAARGGRWPR